MSNPLRTIGLWMLIGFDLALLITLALSQMWYWLFTFTSITLTILTVEGLAKLTTGMTISQQYYKFRKEHPFKSILGLIFFSLAMAGLVIHLF